MEDTVRKLKQSDDAKQKTCARNRKVAVIVLALLLFSGIAVLSVILEKSDSSWILISQALSGSDSSMGSAEAAPTGSTGALPSRIIDLQSLDRIPVYIVGEVNAPGIYLMEPGMFLYQLVELAGGLTARAAKDRINLAFKITCNQMIRIPSIEEVEKRETGVVVEGLLLNDEADFNEGADTPGETAKININTADEKELDELPGIGLATARLIIDYRKRNGKFKVIEDLMKIPGIKQNKFAQIKDQIIV